MYARASCAKTVVDFDRDIAKMNLALALFWVGALHLSAVSSSLLYRTIRDDGNGRDGGSASDSDEPSALDAAPSVAPLVPLRFSFLTTDGGAGEGLRYSDYSIPALELAVEHVNANSSVLPRFNLSYDLKQLEVLLTTKQSTIQAIVSKGLSPI